MAYIVMACIVVEHIVIACIVVAHIVMEHIVLAYIVMALDTMPSNSAAGVVRHMSRQKPTLVMGTG